MGSVHHCILQLCNDFRRTCFHSAPQLGPLPHSNVALSLEHQMGKELHTVLCSSTLIGEITSCAPNNQTLNSIVDLPLYVRIIRSEVKFTVLPVWRLDSCDQPCFL